MSPRPPRRDDGPPAGRGPRPVKRRRDGEPPADRAADQRGGPTKGRAPRPLGPRGRAAGPRSGAKGAGAGGTGADRDWERPRRGAGSAGPGSVSPDRTERPAAHTDGGPIDRPIRHPGGFRPHGPGPGGPRPGASRPGGPRPFGPRGRPPASRGPAERPFDVEPEGNADDPFRARPPFAHSRRGGPAAGGRPPFVRERRPPGLRPEGRFAERPFETRPADRQSPDRPGSDRRSPDRRGPGRPPLAGPRPFTGPRPFAGPRPGPGPRGYQRPAPAWSPAAETQATTAGGETEQLAEGEELIAGRRPVEEAFAAGRHALRLLVAPQRRQALEKIVLHATTLRIPVVEVEGGSLTALAGFDGHQGIALVVDARHFADLQDVLARAIERSEPAFILVLDSLEDPQNVGTLLRSAEAAGVHGVVFPTERQAPLSPAAIKASAGATEHLLLCPVDDLPGALSDLHVRGLRILGAEQDAALATRQADLRGPLAIVVGSEGHGLSPAVRRRCDLFVRIPMRGQIGSLNAAVAGSILLFEAAGQRDPSSPPPAVAPPTEAVAEAAPEDQATDPEGPPVA
jgi:23S rRNA (guanosine2251-2'-O)-methyltransferase